MQCNSCQFENMPGSESCARCGSSMQIATLVMDVQPPRAGRFRKTLRTVVPVRRAYYGVRESVAAASAPLKSSRGSLAPWLGYEPVPWAFIWRSIIPGFAHHHAGQFWRATSFFFGFLAFLIPAILFFGTQFASVMLGLAFSVHTSAALDTYNQYQSDRSFRNVMWSSIKVTLIVGVLIYVPAAWLVSRGAAVRTLETPFGTFHRGDVIWANRSLHWGPFPAVGQIVLYQIPEQQIDVRGARHTIQVYTGERIDRVLAVAGDHVEWNAGQLTVNGNRSVYAPFNPVILPPRLMITVPQDSVLILPTTFPDLSPSSDLQLWESLACVPLDHVEGTVYFRSFPFSRMGIIH